LAVAVLAVAALAVIALPGAGRPEPEVADAQRAGERDARPGEVVVPDQYIVTYNRSAESPAEETETRERRQGFEADYVYRRAVEGFSAELSQRQVDRLEADPEVASVTPDRKVKAVASLLSGEPTPPPGIRRIGAATASTAREASGANVAVIDTGIDLDHPDLDARSGKNCISPGSTADDNGHGTHVAGTIGAKNDGSGVVGVAPGTKLYAAKVLNADGIGTASQVICGIDWVTGTRTDSDPANDIEVANMSLVGTGPPVEPCATTTDPEHKAICGSVAAGVTYVVAAGNGGPDGVGWDFDYAPEPDTPAAYPEVLTVSAMTDSDGQAGGSGAAPACATGEVDDRYASFSNYAATAAGSAHTIAAPGVCIRSTWPGGNYNTISGTSMASAHIAGAVALCLDEGTREGPCAGRSPAEIVEKMRADAASRAAVGGSGFAGDPGQPLSGRYFGYLTWAKAASSDSVPPTIDAVAPANGTTDVTRSAGVAASFSEPMDEAAAASAFSLVRASDGRRVSGTFSWSGNTLIFKPASPLDPATWYTARLSTAAPDSAGNSLAADRAWSFRTLATMTAFPAATVTESGTRRAGSYASLRANDNRYLAINSTRSGTRTSSWYGRFTRISNALRTLKLTSRGKSSARCTHALAIWSWRTSRWVTLDSRSVGTTEIQVDKAPTGTLADYVSGASGDGELRVRARCTRASLSFYTSNDLLRLTYERP
jgi:subtilisin family serine protease